MDNAHVLLANIWFWLLGLILVLYIVLDGFDLGVGVLSLFSREKERRRDMMASLSTTWDANETWLIIFAGALFGAFPLAYAVLLQALYIPVTGMLIGLVLRGVAFEFRVHSRRARLWELVFGCGSLLAAGCQGIIIGALLLGVPVGDSGTFTGGAIDWAHPFCIATVVGVLSGYIMLGATYLIIRTEGALQREHYAWATFAAIFSFLAAIVSMIALPYFNSPLARKWTDGNALYLYVIFACAAFSFLMLIVSLRKRWEYAPFFWAIVVFLFTSLDLGLTLYPYIIPATVPVTTAAASSTTLIFMLTGIGMLVPIIMVYNGYVYLVFHGKVSEQ